jgi:hypothetical protein
VIDETPAAVVAAKRSPDDNLIGLGTEAQARIARQIGAEGCFVVAFGHLHAVAPSPEF